MTLWELVAKRYTGGCLVTVTSCWRSGTCSVVVCAFIGCPATQPESPSRRLLKTLCWSGRRLHCTHIAHSRRSCLDWMARSCWIVRRTHSAVSHSSTSPVRAFASATHQLAPASAGSRVRASSSSNGAGGTSGCRSVRHVAAEWICPLNDARAWVD